MSAVSEQCKTWLPSHNNKNYNQLNSFLWARTYLIWLESSASELDLWSWVAWVNTITLSILLNLFVLQFPIWKERGGGNDQSHSTLWGLNEISYSMYLDFCQVHSTSSINISYYCNCYRNNPVRQCFFFSFFLFYKWENGENETWNSWPKFT